jgi:hypothetical protein
MKARISFVGDVLGEDSIRLTQLAELIESDCELSVEVKRKKSEFGVKNGGLAIGIAIASLGLASLRSLFTVLAYWKSQNPKYSISVTRGDLIETIENLDFERYQKEFGRLAQDSRVKIDVNIERG